MTLLQSIVMLTIAIGLYFIALRANASRVCVVEHNQERHPRRKTNHQNS